MFSSGTGVNMVDLVDDVTPQLGGVLDIGNHSITSDSSANVVIAGNTSVASDAGVKLGSGASQYVYVRDSNGRLGINTRSPGASLDVAGTVLVSNDSEFRAELKVTNHNGTDEGLVLGSTMVTATAAELNILDDATVTTAELNVLDGISATLSAADLSAVENFQETVSATTSAVTIASSKDLNVAGHYGSTNGLKLNGTLVTSTAAELNVLDGITGVTTAILNKLQIAAGGTEGQTQAERFIHTDSENRVDFTVLDGSKPGQIKVANVVISGTTTSSSNTTGALKVTGGAGIAKSVNIGQKLTVFGNTTFNANVTMPGTVTDNRIFYDYTADDLNLKIRSVSIGSTSTSTSDIGATANNVLTIGNGVAPTSLPDGQAYLYAKDVSGETHIHTMDEGGNETQLGPHNKDGEWEFFSRNVKTGKVTRINMERMIRKLEDFTGEKFIETE